MITITIHRDGGVYTGFLMRGHAGYAKRGQDIVCAAVSVLAVNTVNSIEKFAHDRLSVDQADGRMEVTFAQRPSEKATLLLDSMILGLESIRTRYGDKYIRLQFKEVETYVGDGSSDIFPQKGSRLQ